MFDIFKQDVKAGDKVKLSLTTGKEPEGTVLEIGDNFILLESDDKTKSRWFDKMIGGWEVSTVATPNVTPITSVTTVTQHTETKEETKNTKPEYKVGDKIPLDILTERCGRKLPKVTQPKEKVKPKTKSVNDFTKIIDILNPEIKDKIDLERKIESESIVSANGSITKYFADRTFGFITDPFRYDLYFHANDIVDNSLYLYLKSTSTILQIPVVFTLSKNSKGDKAIVIHKPDTVMNILTLAKEKFDNKEYRTASNLIEQILFSYPNNNDALNLQERISKIAFIRPKKAIQREQNFQKAIRTKNVDRNLEEALKYFLLALENNEKRESCIKEIGMLYVAMQKTEEAISFIEQYKNDLLDDTATYNYLTNFYTSVKLFDKVVFYYDKILGKTNFKTNNITTSIYQTNKALALIKMNQEQKAKEVLYRAIKNNRNNDSAIRLLQALNEQNDEEKSQIISFEIDAFGGGFSKLIKDTLENYEDYFGVAAKVIDSGVFTNETLVAIRRLIDTAGRARPRERANYLLTEAKLMISLEPDKENNLRSVLARFCNAMALNHISENSSMDIIRNYYLEAFGLDENYMNTAPQVAIYLASYKSSYSDLLTSKTPSIDDVLNFIIDNDTRESVWEGLLSIFIRSRNISAQIIGKLYDSYRNKALVFLQKTTNTINTTTFSLEDFVNLWNTAIDKRRRDYAKWFAALKAVYNNSNIDVVVNLLQDSLNNMKVNWLPELDLSRLTTISTDIYDALNQYLKQSSYRDKERSYNFAKAQINQLIDEIKEKPTKFSYEGFVPLLAKTSILLDNSFKAVESASTPKVKISILGESSVVANDGSVQIKIGIENSKDSSPIRDIKINIENTEDITVPYIAEHFDSVDGGEICELQIKATLSCKIINDKATTINVICSYKTRNQEEPIEIKNQMSLRLYSEDEFEEIPNPYEILANGGPVTDTKMFYGRNEFIQRITDAIIKTNSKQVVIYGQKRSGKSSVLYHLKKALEATNQTFCISFSIGEIFNEKLSASQLFYKIISKISEEIEFEYGDVPVFKCPAYKEFEEEINPADFFRKQIRLFKKACSAFEKWNNKKLVIMIDEFTYLFAAIREGKIDSGFMKQWKAITQSEDSAYSSVLVGQDVFPMFKDEFPNEFGVTQDERLTYLAKPDAIRLIEEPMGEPKSGKRFIGDAIETIIDYTSRNPYYIQIFCARLVSEMNRKKYMQVTGADVKEIADSFIIGGQALTDDKFDNLLNAGEKYDIQEIPQATTKAVLKKIATNAQNIGYCVREQISIGDKEMEDKVLADLVKREVLEQRNDSYKIQVKLFQEWLLKH